MAYHVIIYRVRVLGFCCPQAYYRATLSLSGGDIGKELGVNRRTANRWRLRFKGLTLSPCSPSCILIGLPPLSP